MYTFQSRVRFSEIDFEGRLSLTALLDYFQDCSVFHSETAGITNCEMLSRRLAWVTSAWQIVVHRYPQLSEEITIGTSPYSLKGFLGLRNFWMETVSGERLAVANSVWSLVNLDTMFPVRIPDDIMEAFPLSEPLAMDYAPRKLPFPNEGEVTEFANVTVHTHHLDTNNHVNNGQFVKIASSVLPRCHVRQMRAEYHKQALLGDSLTPVLSTRLQNNDAPVYTVALNDAAGNPYCVFEMETDVASVTKAQ